VEEAPEIKEVESPAAAPDFTVPLVSGGEAKLADYQGKILVLDFWATWCVGCVEELPDYQALYESWDTEKVAYIGMSLDGDASTVAAFLEGRPEITLPMAIAPPEVVDAYIPRRTLPSSRVIDASGVLRYEFTGPGAEKVGAAVEALLAEGGEG
jgi:thiol-disulfide isomerase/thioredoxin